MTQIEGTSALARGLAQSNLVPLWTIAKNLVRHEPVQAFPAHIWPYEAVVRPAMMAVGEAALGEEAERRVLLLANPAFPRPATTGTLIAGMQLIFGGEVADAHRHTQSALRVVIEGEGAYTAVNGERCAMHRGDLILTPGGSWHDHEKTSEGPMIWLDGLDVPLVNYLGVTFFEDYDGAQFPTSRPDGFSKATFGRALRPMAPALASLVSAEHNAPQLHYPYVEARAALDLMRAAGPADPVDGWKLRYTNAMTGGHILPAIGAHLQRLPAGFVGADHRGTDARIVVVLEGSGTTRIGETEIAWRENDVLAIPNWAWHAHRAEAEAVLFSFSDIALQEKLGLWRDERSAA